MPQRWAIDIEYIGAAYAGSQIQCEGGSNKSSTSNNPEQCGKGKLDKKRINNPDIKTIQGELEQALSTLIKTNTKTIFSGRTDAGVNALAQVAHFDTDCEIDSNKMLNSLNALLPNDISVKNLREVDKTFHAQKSAKWRWYRYIIANRKHRSTWDKPSLLIRNGLDIERINESLGYLKGKHDFTTFKCSKTENPAKECNIYIAQASKTKNDMIYIDLVADRFLYNMVRIIVGTMLMIEENSLPPSVMKEILESKDRQKAGKTVTPEGLYLMKVEYNNNSNMEAIINENLFC